MFSSSHRARAISTGGIICPRRLPKRQPPFPNDGAGMSMTPMSCRIGHQHKPILYYTSCRCLWVNQSHVSLGVHSSVLRTYDTSETGRSRLTNMISLSEYRIIPFPSFGKCLELECWHCWTVDCKGYWRPCRGFLFSSFLTLISTWWPLSAGDSWTLPVVYFI